MSRRETERDDLGLRVVAELRRRCGVDEEWSVDTGRGFRWWPHRQAQHDERGNDLHRARRRAGASSGAAGVASSRTPSTGTGC